jgi:transcription antitermination protein NusB
VRNKLELASIILHRCAITLTKSPLLNRRFIRLQAVLHFYAFYVCKQANYDWALDQIRDAFIPDVFADLPISNAQLAQETQQALTLFASSLLPTSASFAAMAPPSSRVSAVASRALASYQNELAKDIRKLEKGLTEAVTTINRACLYIWQLLVVWAHIAKRQSERPKLSQQHAMASPVCLSHSPMLQRLQDDGVLAKLVQQGAAGWEEYMSLAENWYNQFVKQNSTVQCCLVHPITPVQDQQLLTLLIEDIIFSQEAIQSFFGELDLQWATHKRIVRKLIRRGLTQLIQNSGESPSSVVHDVAAYGEAEQCFYTDLVCKTLKHDEALEILIAEKAKNWTVDRIMLLDKTIIKLALCEMLYFANIPINVSINEYIDLSKIYSMPKSSQFVNGLLDAIAATLPQGGGNKA